MIAIRFHPPYIIYFLVHVNTQQNNSSWLITYDMSSTLPYAGNAMMSSRIIFRVRIKAQVGGGRHTKGTSTVRCERTCGGGTHVAEGLAWSSLPCPKPEDTHCRNASSLRVPVCLPLSCDLLTAPASCSNVSGFGAHTVLCDWITTLCCPSAPRQSSYLFPVHPLLH